MRDVYKIKKSICNNFLTLKTHITVRIIDLLQKLIFHGTETSENITNTGTNTTAASFNNSMINIPRSSILSTTDIVHTESDLDDTNADEKIRQNGFLIINCRQNYV